MNYSSLGTVIYQPSVSYSSLENIAHSEASHSSFTHFSNNYSTHQNAYNNSYIISKPHIVVHQTNDLLSPNRPRSKFIGTLDQETKELIENTFQLIAGEFPNDIQITICNKEQLKATHNSISKNWSDGIKGFSINRKHEGQLSEIFVLNDELDQLMLTIGHELGHVMTKKLSSSLDEEAKAFAFSFAWMKTLAGSANIHFSMSDRPAKNGLHDSAFNFVSDQVKSGKDPITVFNTLASKVTSDD